MLPRMPTPAVHLGLDAVIFAVTAEAPRILTVRSADADDALPSGPLDLETHPTLERGVRDWVAQQTGLALGYVEQEADTGRYGASLKLWELGSAIVFEHPVKRTAA